MKILCSLLFCAVFGLCIQAQSDSLLHPPFPYQISFVPPLSTNGINNRLSTNQLSINILAGHSGAIKGLELGGIANLVSGPVHGIQASGCVNVVGGPVRGTQLAGFANLDRSGCEGLQLAGFVNVSNDTSRGMQAAGFGNVLNGSFEGLQAAGFLNVTNGSVQGFQAAGFANILSDSLRGIQASGFYNQCGNAVEGGQFAGFMNLCGGRLHGVQASGFLNVTKTLHGLQLGFINVVDSLEKGTPIGFLNFVRKGGFQALEIQVSETYSTTLKFKLGSPAFYTLFLGSVRAGSTPWWTYGLGFGSVLKPQGKLRIHLDLEAQHTHRDWEYQDQLNLHARAQVGFSWQLARRFALTLGPSFNVLVQEVSNPLPATPSIAPYTLSNKVYGQTRVALWPGAFFALRF